VLSRATKLSTPIITNNTVRVNPRHRFDSMAPPPEQKPDYQSLFLKITGR
jgi:hypothetical protein